MLLDAVKLSLFDLVNNDKRPLLLSLLSQNLAFFLQLEGLESLNLHHEVQAFLLVDPLAFKPLRLFKLTVADGHDLGIEHHLVHVLNVIVILVHHLLGFGEETFCLLAVNYLLLSGRHLVGSLLV